VLVSTRPGRVGLPVGTWFVERAEAHDGFDVEVVHLAELDLPFLDEPEMARLGEYTQPHTLAWSATVARADAFVFVMPEYNHGISAPLKNAIDYLFAEWNYKPVGFVSYGGVAAGTRAVEQTMQIATAVRMTPVLEGVPIPFVAQRVDAERTTFRADESLEAKADAVLDELGRVEETLRPLRSAAVS
jgi:NAD(P)H-dependent FMN reductase